MRISMLGFGLVVVVTESGKKRGFDCTVVVVLLIKSRLQRPTFGVAFAMELHHTANSFGMLIIGGGVSRKQWRNM